MELIRDGDHHCIHVRIRQHVGELVVDELGLIDRGDLRGQVPRDVADGEKIRIRRLADRVEMGGLRDWPTADQGNAQTPFVFGDHRHSICAETLRRAMHNVDTACAQAAFVRFVPVTT